MGWMIRGSGDDQRIEVETGTTNSGNAGSRVNATGSAQLTLGDCGESSGHQDQT